MSIDPTYEELAEVIARYVYNHLYHQEERVDGAMEWNVDNMCMSTYQMATGVLTRLDLMAPLDDLARRNEFICAPDEFPKVIARNKKKGCSYFTLMLTLVWLLQQDERPELRSYCSDLGLIEPGDSPDIIWTAEAEPYCRYYKDWPWLLDE